MTLRSRFLSGFRFQPELPGDKSITHRAFLLGALASGETVVEGANLGADCAATLSAVENLGAKISRDRAETRIEGRSGRLQPPGRTLNLENSGTGLRLLLGVLAGQAFSTELTGDASLRQIGRASCRERVYVLV